MERDFEKAISFWQKRFTQFQRLQIIYVIVLVLSLVTAGLISLLNQPAGQAILVVSKISGIALVTNSVVHSFLPREPKPRSIKRK